MSADQWSLNRYTVDGAELIADQTGDVPVFLLLHAGGEKRRVWYPIMRTLAQSGYGAIAVDQRGHGESTGAPGDGICKYADDVAEIIRDTGRKVIAVGASLGGFAVMLAMADSKVRRSVAGVVLVDVVPDPQPERVRAFLRTTAPPLDTSLLVDDILAQSDLLARACEQIQVAVMLIVAGQSAITQSEIERLHARVANLAVEHIADASHLIAEDKPDELARALLNFAMQSDVREALDSRPERMT